MKNTNSQIISLSDIVYNNQQHTNLRGYVPDKFFITTYNIGQIMF